MFRQFLEQSSIAMNLDRGEFDRLFGQGIPRADFLLFDRSVVYEVKEVENLDVERQVRKLAKKGIMATDVFNQHFCNSIINALRKANRQVSCTKNALGLPNALGLIILENLIPEKMPALTLLSVANQMMEKELPSFEGVLCADMINYLEDGTGDKVRLVQLMARGTPDSERLATFTDTLVKNMCSQQSIRFRPNVKLDAAHQLWHAEADGKYKRYAAGITFAHEMKDGCG